MLSRHALASLLVLLTITTPTTAQRPVTPDRTFHANELIRRQPSVFVPNLGQWDHPAKFVHRNGPMTVFLEERGWVMTLDADRTIRGVAVRMTFEGSTHVPEIVGEKKLPGHHNYFLGNDEKRWRTGVPLFASVRYDDLYPGIDLRLRELNGVPEYDLLLQPGADLALVTVHVEGGRGLSIARNGSLVIATALGPVTQPMPKTWQVDADGEKRAVTCNFVLLGADRFGFSAPGWDGARALVVDPGLLWSTFLLGANNASGVSVDAAGVVTVVGLTGSSTFRTTPGAYQTTLKGSDAFISRLDPSQTGQAQLVYSTFLGGTRGDNAGSVSVDANGVVTVTGTTSSPDFPTTPGAYDTTFNGGSTWWPDDVFVSRLDPSKTGAAQLVYSTFLGGNNRDQSGALSSDVTGVVTLTGYTYSTDFPVTNGAYDTSHNGGPADVFVSRLDPRLTGNAQLVYSTFLGGTSFDEVRGGLSVDASGVVTVAGRTGPGFPTTPNAYDTVHNGATDAFISRLDPSKTGSGQLVYSTYMGGGAHDQANSLAVDSRGVVTVTGGTGKDPLPFPTTPGAYDTTHNGYDDAFVSRLDPSLAGSAQLVYSTFLGGGSIGAPDTANALSVDANGVVTVAGVTGSTNFPTTPGAYDTTYNGGYYDVFVSRLDPSKSGSAQLVYSTFIGGTGPGSAMDLAADLAVDPSGVVTLAGFTDSSNYPTTPGAYSTTFGGTRDAIVSRLAITCLAGTGTPKPGNTMNLALSAPGDAGLVYRLGSSLGTGPIKLGGRTIGLSPDNLLVVSVNGRWPTIFTGYVGTIDNQSQGTAAIRLPNIAALTGQTIHTAFVTLKAAAPFGVQSISNTYSFQIQ